MRILHNMEAQPTTRPPVITAEAHGTGSSPESVALTVDGVTTIVDVGCDRDDWQLPEVADGHEHRLLWAIDDAIEAWHADNAVECRRIERVWARRAA